MGEEKIYYYTSNFVMKQWMKNEKIWATRSTSSNDSEDTIYGKRLFDQINYSTNGIYQEKLKDISCIVSLSSSISNRFYKDLLFDFQNCEFDKYLNIAKSVNRRKEWCYYGNNYNIFEMKKWQDNCGSFHFGHLETPTIGEWLFSNILMNLSEKKLALSFGLTVSSIRRVKKYIMQMPYMHFPFVICFTSEKDNRFFWDAYTNNIGVAMEFERDELDTYFKSISTGYKYPFKLQNVIYDEKEQIESIIKQVENLDDELLLNEAESVCVNMAYYKHPYWRNEQEVRAVVPRNYFDNSEYIKENYNTKYSNGLISQDYTEIPIPRRLVHKIIIGPQNELLSQLTVHQYNNIEKYLGIGIDVEISNGAGVTRI